MSNVAKALLRQMFQTFAAALVAFSLAFAPFAASANPALFPTGSVQTLTESADAGVSPDGPINVDAAEVLHHAHCACSASLAPVSESATAERKYDALTFAPLRDDLLSRAAFNTLFRPPRA